MSTRAEVVEEGAKVSWPYHVVIVFMWNLWNVTKVFPCHCKSTKCFHVSCGNFVKGAAWVTFGRIPVSTYWGFQGPGSQYKSRQHCLGISFLSCWVVTRGLTSPVCSKSLNVVWAVLHEMLRFRAIFLNESSITIRSQTTLQRRSGEYADLRPGSADIVIVLVFTNSNQPHFPARCILDSPKSGILIQETGDESCYDLRAYLMPCLNETEICINCTRRIIANAESSMQ